MSRGRGHGRRGRHSPNPEAEEYRREKEIERLMRAPLGGPVPLEEGTPTGSPPRTPGQRKGAAGAPRKRTDREKGEDDEDEAKG